MGPITFGSLTTVIRIFFSSLEVLSFLDRK